MLVELTKDELGIINNALNEVCNGIDLKGEFETRMGCTVEQARQLLAKIQTVALSNPMRTNGQDFYFRFRSSRSDPFKVWLEPWGEMHILKPGGKFLVKAVGPIREGPDNMLEIECSDDCLTVWGWGGSGVDLHTL